MTKTLAHELAHHFHETLLGGESESRAERETVAESVAYVVCSHYGLDTGERSFPYVAIWAKDRNVFKGALQRIQRVSARIIDGLDGTRAERGATAVAGGGAAERRAEGGGGTNRL